MAEVNQWCCLEESGKLLENVDQTHIVPASGKLVLKKKISINCAEIAFPVKLQM